MSSIQLAYHESQCDIKICSLVNQKKLYGIGFCSSVKRLTLADANEGRHWHIWKFGDCAAYPACMQAVLYNSVYVDLANTVYALDVTAIEWCLSFSQERRFILPRRPSSCIRFWICVATSRLLFPSRMARWEMPIYYRLGTIYP
jgi:hypothetical protein